MKYKNNDIFNFLLPFINKKINDISLALKINIIKNNLYEQVFADIYYYVSKNIVELIVDKINNLDINLIEKRLGILIDNYLKGIK